MHLSKIALETIFITLLTALLFGVLELLRWLRTGMYSSQTCYASFVRTASRAFPTLVRKVTLGLPTQMVQAVQWMLGVPARWDVRSK